MDLVTSIGKYLRRHWHTAILWAGIAVCFAVVFYLYDLPLEAVLYAALLSATLLAGSAAAGFFLHYRQHRRLSELEFRIMVEGGSLPEPRNQIDEDYNRLISAVLRDRAARMSEAAAYRSDMTEYYTTWGHQIKTPLAAMRLLLQNDLQEEGVSPERALELLRGELSEELQKTEQYVDMALQYLRLDSASSDFVFKEYSLDDILKQALREYSGMFIRKRIVLNYRQTGITVVTDEKWLLFVIGQILSNALKYTDSGKISIYTQMSEAERPSELNAEDGGPLGEVPVPGDEESRGGGTAPSEDSCPEPAGIFLVIEDTGIGIAPEDLYRVFEKGFTGYNGRENKKATGLGLYLCRRILDKLSHTIEIESELGRGTKVKIGLERYEVKGE